MSIFHVVSLIPGCISVLSVITIKFCKAIFSAGTTRFVRHSL